MNWSRIFVVTIVFGAVALLANGPIAYGDAKPVLGWVELVRVLPENLIVTAKLDTGADTSSIDAQQLAKFERDGRPWVRFSVSNHKGDTAVIERPVIRVVRVKRGETETTTRPVVMLAICLGGKFREEAVTLTNRSHLSYRVLIGRSAMAGRFLENPALKFTTPPDCLRR